MKGKIGNRLLRTLNPRRKPYEIVDTNMKGFVLRVMPSGNMAYYVRYRLLDGRQTRLKLGGADVLTPAQARDLAKDALADAAKGQDPGRSRRHAREHTLRSFVEDVYRPWMSENRRTGNEICNVILAAFPELLEKKLSDISAWCVEKWRKTKLRGHCSSSTTNRYIAYLKAMFTRAVDWGFVAENPLRRVKMDREDTSRVRFLDGDETQRLRDALDAREGLMRQGRDSANAWRRERGYRELPSLRKMAFADHLKPMVLLSLNTGLRRGELFNLQWSDVDIKRAMLTVRADSAKTGKARHIPLNSIAADVLAKWQEQTSSDGLVFPGKDGQPFDNCNTAWKTVLEEAGIRDFRWHDMRHEFASKLVMAGVDLYVVKELLGHSSIQMTERYAHLAPSVKTEAVEALAKASQYNSAPKESAKVQLRVAK